MSSYNAIDIEKQLSCIAVNRRIGEIFVDIGIELVHEDIVAYTIERLGLTKWEVLVAYTDQSIHLQQIVEIKSVHKVCKILPSRTYLCKVRVFSEKFGCWGQWSPAVTLVSFHPVITSVVEVGEQEVRLQWGRANHAEIMHENSESVAKVFNISKYGIRVLREKDSKEVQEVEVEQGIRSYTIGGLESATAYIVFARYETLIGTMKKWMEVGRILTQSPYEVIVNRVGEDQVSVSWQRSELIDIDTYKFHTKGDAVIDQFELSIQSENGLLDLIDLPSSMFTYTIHNLTPETKYKLKISAGSVDGKWNTSNRTVIVTTLTVPLCNLTCVGQSFATLQWSHDSQLQPDKMMVELTNYAIQHIATYTLDSQQIERNYFLLEELCSSTTYNVRVRFYYQSQWGTWGTMVSFTTNPELQLCIYERTEDRIVFNWLETYGTIFQYNFVLTEVPANSDAGIEMVVCDETIYSSDNCRRHTFQGLKPNTPYQIKVRVYEVDGYSGYENWTVYTPPLHTFTLKSLALQVTDLTEHFLTLKWFRHREDLMQKLEHCDKGFNATNKELTELADILNHRYEITIEELKSGKLIISESNITSLNYTTDQLQPDTYYMAAVRVCGAHSQVGQWIRIAVKTLPVLQLKVHALGESYVRLMWYRDSKVEMINEMHQSYPNSIYALFIYSTELPLEEQVANTDVGYPYGGNSEIQIVEQVSIATTSYFTNRLYPGRTYTAVLRGCSFSGIWGAWSQPVCFRTTNQFRINEEQLHIGEQHVYFTWSRADDVTLEMDVVKGDYSVMEQLVCIQGINTSFYKEYTLNSKEREYCIRELTPAHAYKLQHKSCSAKGEWGNWSYPVHFMTKNIVECAVHEISEHSISVLWKQPAVYNPNHYIQGKSQVTSYHLKVMLESDEIVYDVHVLSSDFPHRLDSVLSTNTFYCVYLKANYNDKEWGYWSDPLWCLTMHPLEISNCFIGEEFCNIIVHRPHQKKRLPNTAVKCANIKFGDTRVHYKLDLLEVEDTQSIFKELNKASWNTYPSKHIKSIEWTCKDSEFKHTILRLKPSTLYTITTTSKNLNDQWGQWSSPYAFITLPSITISFLTISEDYIAVSWDRIYQFNRRININQGVGVISLSKIRIRGANRHLVVVDHNSPETQSQIGNLQPASTYYISIKTFTDEYWTEWSKEVSFQTLPGLTVVVNQVGEDSVWFSWCNSTYSSSNLSQMTQFNTNYRAQFYEIEVTGGHGFNFTRQTEGVNCFLRGLQPDSRYEIRIRCHYQNNYIGMWHFVRFCTLPMVYLSIKHIGENYVISQWRRNSSKQCQVENIPGIDPDIKTIRIRIQEYNQTQSIAYEFSSETSLLTIQDLKPSTVYFMSVSAQITDNMWGLWSHSQAFVTQSEYSIQIQEIGEDYSALSWNRLPLPLEEIKNIEANGTSVHAFDVTLTEYEIEVYNENTQCRVVLSTDTHTFHLSKLMPSHIYQLSVRARDTTGNWGFWCSHQRFKTLASATVHLLCTTEYFAAFQWNRCSDHIQPPASNIGGNESEKTVEPHFNLTSKPITLLFPNDETHLGLNSAILPTNSTPLTLGNESVTEWKLIVLNEELYFSILSDLDDQGILLPGDTNTYVAQHLVPDKNYWVAVKARNTHGKWGVWSKFQQVQTLPTVQVMVDMIGEDICNISWKRPECTTKTCKPVFSIYSESQFSKNYQVYLLAHTNEPVDYNNIESSPVLRVQETTQQFIELKMLRPGTTYRIAVREQMINQPELCNLFDSSGYGGFNSPISFITLSPIVVASSCIGEKSIDINWFRQSSASLNTPTDSIESTSTTTEFELKIHQLTTLNTIVPDSTRHYFLPSTTSSFQIDHLLSNSIYKVSVRAEIDQRHWGYWSEPLIALTQNRISVSIDLVCESKVYLSWWRELPSMHPDKSGILSRIHAQVSSHNEKECATNAVEDIKHTYGSISNSVIDMDNMRLLLGDYYTNECEVCLRRVSLEDPQFCSDPIELEEQSNSYTTLVSTKYNDSVSFQSKIAVSNLKSNSVYILWVRTLCSNNQFSPWSLPHSFATHFPLKIDIKKLTEQTVELVWRTKPQDLADYAKVLEKFKIDLSQNQENKRVIRHRNYQSYIQNLQDNGENILEHEEQIFNSIEAYKTHNDIGFLHSLEIGSIVTHNEHIFPTYEFYLKGSAGHPCVEGIDHISMHNLAPEVGITALDAVYYRTKTMLFDISKDEEKPPKDSLIHVLLSNDTRKIKVVNLEPGLDMQVMVRRQILYDEWDPWSDTLCFTTLEKPLLIHEKFSENYISLYWFRDMDLLDTFNYYKNLNPSLNYSTIDTIRDTIDTTRDTIDTTRDTIDTTRDTIDTTRDTIDTISGHNRYN